MKSFFYLVVGLVIILGSVFLFLKQPTVRDGQVKIVKINDASIKAEIVRTPEARQKGLSGREVLSDGSGMLFVFDSPARHGFWMKNMNFAIDIVWIDDEFRVVGMEKEVSPETFPQIFYPSQPVKYVLELPAGFLEKHYIDIGTVIQ